MRALTCQVGLARQSHTQSVAHAERRKADEEVQHLDHPMRATGHQVRLHGSKDHHEESPHRNQRRKRPADARSRAKEREHQTDDHVQQNETERMPGPENDAEDDEYEATEPHEDAESRDCGFHKTLVGWAVAWSTVSETTTHRQGFAIDRLFPNAGRPDVKSWPRPPLVCGGRAWHDDEAERHVAQDRKSTRLNS